MQCCFKERRYKMENSGLSASDVLALTRGNDDMFGGVGRFYTFIYIFNGY